MKRRVCGVGINNCPGFRSGTKEQRWVYMAWVSMLTRCYNDKKLATSSTYSDCTVCERWLTLSNFVSDVPLLPGFSKVIDNDFRGVALDKDGLVPGNKEYSPDTCQWLTISENAHERDVRGGWDHLNTEESRKKANIKTAITEGRSVVGIDPEGGYHEWFGTREVERSIGVSHGGVRKLCNGDPSHTMIRGPKKGWSFYWKEEYRYDDV